MPTNPIPMHSLTEQCGDTPEARTEYFGQMQADADAADQALKTGRHDEARLWWALQGLVSTLHVMTETLVRVNERLDRIEARRAEADGEFTEDMEPLPMLAASEPEKWEPAPIVLRQHFHPAT